MSKKKNNKEFGLPGIGQAQVSYSLDFAPIKQLTEEEEQIKVPKKSTFKVSGHLTGQILKYEYPEGYQYSLLDVLKEETIKEIEASGRELKETVEGIRLSRSEQKVSDCIAKLLHEQSQNEDPSKEDYYIGNGDIQLVRFGSERKPTPSPSLAISLFQITKEYKGTPKPSGKDMENVGKILKRLSERKFLLRYTEEITLPGGKKKVNEIEDFVPLIRLPRMTQTILDGDVEVSKKQTFLVILNPIYRRQIEGMYVIYPSDINTRMAIAYGAHDIPEPVTRLRVFLADQVSKGNLTVERNCERLYWQLSDAHMKQSRKSKVKKDTVKAIETCKKLGLIEKCDIKKGAKGQDKYIFHLNKNWTD